MASVNKVILVGNLGRDPEVRYTANGNAMCNMSIATTYKTKDPSGQYQEETEWHRVVMFNRLAEIAGEYLKKGRPVYIEGRLRTRKWQGQDGQDKYTTEILADSMQMLGGRGEVPNQPTPQTQPNPNNQQARQPRAPQQNYQAANYDGGGMADMDDDIPFNAYFARNAYCI